MSKYKVLAVNGGNGVICYPFRRKVIANIEPRSTFHTKGENQWYLNFDAPIYKSLVESGLQPDDVDVIVGAPNCGHSSVLAFSRAKKYGNAKEDKSMNTFIKAIHLYRPKVFYMENLPALLKQYPEMDFRELFNEYRLAFHQATVALWGNSQFSRKRLVIIGVHKDVPSRADEYFKQIYPVNGLKTTKELLVGLSKPSESLCNVREDDSKVVCMEYQGKKLNLKEVRDTWPLMKGTRWEVGGKMKNLPGVYRNPKDSAPMTVRGANRQFNPDGYQLTPRECARIQGLPDSFRLWYDRDQHEYCINKGRVTVAKSPPYEIGLWFRKQINRSGIFK